VQEALPIKCIEGVFLALYLTSEIQDVERVPISFKSTVNGQVYRHIVLAIRYGNRYGALGISRRKELGYQPLQFDSLSELMMRYKQSYEQWWHTLLGIKVGLPVPHSVLSQEKICWRFCNVKVPKSPAAWERKVQMPLDKFARNWHKSLDQWRLEGAPDDDIGRDLPAVTAGQSPSSVPTRWVKSSPKKGSPVKGKKAGKVQSMAAKAIEVAAAAKEEGGNEVNDDSSSSDEDEEEEEEEGEEEEEEAEEGEEKGTSEAAAGKAGRAKEGLPARRVFQPPAAAARSKGAAVAPVAAAPVMAV